MQLSKLQEKIVNTTEPYVAVYAAAAAGKTATLTERVRKMLRDGINPSDIAVITFTNLAAQELRDRLADDYKNGIYIGTIHGLANYFLLSHGIDTSDLIKKEEFDMFFQRIKENPHCIKHIKHILLDEAQDTSPDEYKFIFNMIKPETFFIVGDLRQCQPAGTKVFLRGGKEKNIEDVVVGDEIIYYDTEKGRCSGIKGTTYNSVHKYVINTASRDFVNDNLITIITENGKQSSYTPNHRTFVKLNYIENKQIVYLMCDKNYRFRIGQVPLFYTGNKNNGHGVNPWRTKMKNERCEKIWILKICDSIHEASVEETKLSYQYQIPQTCWQTDKVKWTVDDINYIYQGLDTKKSAESCLKNFNLDINYPLLDLSIDWMAKGHFATNATVEIYANNLIPNYMSCVCYGSENSHSNKHYEKITSVTKQYITEPIKVYSLETDGGTYVADQIITHNSIYSFKGCDPEIFDRLMENPEVTVYSLNENYRNGDNILNYAKKILQKSYMDDDSVAMRHGGVVWEGEATLDNLKGWIQSKGEYRDWAVLCTTNATIDYLRNRLESFDIPTVTFRQGEVTKDQLESLMNSNSVKVLTYWSSKGLEFPYVAAWEPKQWGGDETYRVNYVGATRAKDVLLWMREPKKLKKTTKKEKSKWF